MRAVTFYVIFLSICVYFSSQVCEPDQYRNGCKVLGGSCSCNYGCKTEYIYRTRRVCLNALRAKELNACYRVPCLRGVCTQTVTEPGFECKCDGTGFHGQRCEKAEETSKTTGC